MNANDIYNNDINKKLENITKELELLRIENAKNKEIIQKNKESILNSNKQLLQIKEEYNRNMFVLQEKYNKQFGYLTNYIVQNFNKDNANNINKIQEKDENKIPGFFHIKDDLSQKNIFKENNENFNFKIRTLIDKFEFKLDNIFIDVNPNIGTNDLNDLKKLSIALIIKKQNPQDLLSFYLNKNKINNYNKENINQLVIVGSKKSKINEFIAEMQNISLNKIEKIKINEFIKQLREKCGFTEEDINDEDLMKEIKKHSYDKANIILSILTKSNLFKEE